MPTKPFKVSPFDPVYKRVDLWGPNDVHLEVDYDDVDHPTVRKTVKRMVEVLNKHWSEEGVCR